MLKRFSLNLRRLATATVACICISNFGSTTTNAQTVSNGLVKMEFAGTNPGKLDAFVYVPTTADKTKPIPMVVALHGCSQNATTLADLSGWNTLADRYGFCVMYPQQRAMNNLSTCFNWFNKWDAWRDEGEVLSIKQMIEQATTNFNVDKSNVCVYGVSAGAAMAVALMVDYPAMFKAGASYAGAPFGAAKDAMTGMSVMASPVYKTQAEWSQLVKAQNPDYTGTYPKLVALHGTSDAVVDLQNTKQLLIQWTAIHNTDGAPDDTTKAFANNTDVTRYAYRDKNNNNIATYFEIRNLGHSLLVDPGTGETQGGKTGNFSVDKDFFSTYWIAVEFGLIENDTALKTR